MRRPASWLVSLSFSFSAAGLAVSAIAQDRPAAAAPVRAEDTVLAEVRRGRSARDAGRWVEAEAAFKAALAAGGSERTAEVLRAEITGELGLCELRQGKHRDAAEHLARSLTRREALDPALRRRFEEGQRSAERHVERVYLGVSPSDAEVFVDGKPIGGRERSYRLVLEPGHHTLRAQLIGHGGAEDSFESVAGKQRTASLVLRRAPDPAAAAVPPSRPPAPALPPPAAPSSEATALRIAGAVTAGATAALGATLLGLSAAADARVDSRSAELRAEGWDRGACVGRSSAPECEDLRQGRDQRNLMNGVGWASLALGSAIGAATLVSLFLEEPPPSGRGLRVVPLTTGQDAVLMVLGTW